jgi:DNA-binding XRE family transcriptional regulator
MVAASDDRRSLREVRRRAMYSIKGLAAEVGISPTTIMDVEHGRRVPRLATIRAICRTLGIDPLTVEEFARVIEGEGNRTSGGED